MENPNIVSISHALRNIRSITKPYLQLIEDDPNSISDQELVTILEAVDVRLEGIIEAIDNCVAEL